SFNGHRLIEPHSAEPPGSVLDQGCRQSPLLAGLSGIEVDDTAAYRLQFAGFQPSDRPQVGEVLIIARQVEQKLLDRLDSEFTQLLRALRSDAFDELDGARESLGLSCGR